VAELVDALDSKSSFFGSAGSIPALGTLKTQSLVMQEVGFFYAQVCLKVCPFLQKDNSIPALGTKTSTIWWGFFMPEKFIVFSFLTRPRSLHFSLKTQPC
jgi:hypothetical protein